MSYEAIKEIWKEIPKFQCISGCRDCCGPIVMSRLEWENIEPKINATGITCPYSSKDGCAIYENRPTICRLFGAVNHPLQTCNHGCGPAFKLTDAQARDILSRVRKEGE